MLTNLKAFTLSISIAVSLAVSTVAAEPTNKTEGAIAQALLNDSQVDEAEREQIKATINNKFPNWRTSAGIASRDTLLNQNIDWTLRAWRVQNTNADSTPEDFN